MKLIKYVRCPEGGLQKIIYCAERCQQNTTKQIKNILYIYRILNNFFFIKMLLLGEIYVGCHLLYIRWLKSVQPLENKVQNEYNILASKVSNPSVKYSPTFTQTLELPKAKIVLQKQL